MKEPRFRVDARALESAIIERGFSLEHFRKATRIHPTTMHRLLDDSPGVRRDFRTFIVRLLLNHLKMPPERIVPDQELSEEDRKSLTYRPKPTKKSHDLKEMYTREPTGNKPTWRPDRARRRDFRRHGDGSEEVA